MSPSARWSASLVAGVLFVMVAVAFLAYSVWFGIALGVVMIISELWRRLVRALDQPLTDADRYYSSLDQEWDELEARRATRPHGNCEVIPFPDIPRHRGGRGPYSLRLDDDSDGAA